MKKILIIGLLISKMSYSTDVLEFYFNYFEPYVSLSGIKCKTRVAGYLNEQLASEGGEPLSGWSVHYYEDQGRIRIEVYRDHYFVDGRLDKFITENNMPFSMMIYDGETSAHYSIITNLRPYRYEVTLYAGRGPGSAATLNGNLFLSPMMGILPLMRDHEGDAVISISDLKQLNALAKSEGPIEIARRSVNREFLNEVKKNTMEYAIEGLPNNAFSTQYLVDVADGEIRGYAHQYQVDGEFLTLSEYKVTDYSIFEGIPYPAKALFSTFNVDGESTGCGIMEVKEFIPNAVIDDALFEIEFEDVAKIVDHREGVVLKLGYDGEIVSVENL